MVRLSIWWWFQHLSNWEISHVTKNVALLKLYIWCITSQGFVLTDTSKQEGYVNWRCIMVFIIILLHFFFAIISSWIWNCIRWSVYSQSFGIFFLKINMLNTLNMQFYDVINLPLRSSCMPSGIFGFNQSNGDVFCQCVVINFCLILGFLEWIFIIFWQAIGTCFRSCSHLYFESFFMPSGIFL